MTVAPGRIMSPVTSFGWPAAAIRISARLQTSPRSRVRLWQMVGVALAPSSSEKTGRPDQVGAADDHRLLAGRIDARRGEQLHDPLRRARHEARFATGEAAGADRREPVHVLVRVEGVDDRGGVDLIGKRQLDEDAVDLVRGVELPNEVEQLVLGDGPLRLAVDRPDPDLLAGLALAAHVDRGRGVVADQHRRQSGRAAERPESSSTSPRTRSRTEAATALPSITVAAISSPS